MFQVSKDWHAIVGSCAVVWKNACVRLGVPALEDREKSYFVMKNLANLKQIISGLIVVNSISYRNGTESRRLCQNSRIASLRLSENLDGSQHYKKLYCRTRQTLDVICHGQAFTSSIMSGHSDRVMAVAYHKGLIATGSDDRYVRIWEAATGNCIRMFRTHTVAGIKFDDAQVFTASFDTTACCWDMDGNLKQQFIVSHYNVLIIEN